MAASALTFVKTGTAGRQLYRFDAADKIPVSGDGITVKVNGAAATWTGVLSENAPHISITTPTIAGGERIEVMVPTTVAGQQQSLSTHPYHTTAT